MEYKHTELRINSTNNHIDDIIAAVADPTTNHYYGPALGLGFSYPMTDVYFFSINISGLYMTGDFKLKDERISWLSDGIYDNVETSQLKGPMRQIGINVEPVIGMNPGNNLPIITLGVRYQRSRWQTTESNDATGDKGKSFDDTVIGAFVSIVFMF